MCVIISSPNESNRPSLATLSACERANPHGSGLAWVQQGRVYYIKGLSAAAIHDSLRELSGPVIIHFRIATVGGVKKSLCHPFPVCAAPPAKRYGNAKSVLFHNGTWSGWRDYMRAAGLTLAGDVSDSRVAAAVVHELGFPALAEIPCRWALLSHTGKTRLLGDWSRESDGCSYSNRHWLSETRRPEKSRGRGYSLPPRRSLYDEAIELLEA